jgi:hydrogenase nickel incorporation protein HypA/HybF
MHELSIAQALVEQVEAVAAKEQASRVARVSIVVGALSGVDPEALRAAFPLVAEGTVAGGAELEIEQVAARVSCRVCGRESAAEGFFMVCGACGSKDVELSAGRELNFKSVELVVDER